MPSRDDLVIGQRYRFVRRTDDGRECYLGGLEFVVGQEPVWCINRHGAEDYPAHHMSCPVELVQEEASVAPFNISDHIPPVVKPTGPYVYPPEGTAMPLQYRPQEATGYHGRSTVPHTAFLEYLETADRAYCGLLTQWNGNVGANAAGCLPRTCFLIAFERGFPRLGEVWILGHRTYPAVYGVNRFGSLVGHIVYPDKVDLFSATGSFLRKDRNYGDQMYDEVGKWFMSNDDLLTRIREWYHGAP